jgi:hypothetical protein
MSRHINEIKLSFLRPGVSELTTVERASKATRSGRLQGSRKRQVARGRRFASSHFDNNVALTRWALKLAVVSLILAGCLALFLVLGRIPVLAERISDPQFFKRCLVVHVNLSLVVWFLSFSAALFALLPGDAWSDGAFKTGCIVAAIGVIGMIMGAAAHGAVPVLSNYVPMIAHPIFGTGVVLLFFGLLLCFANGRLLGPALSRPDSALSPLGRAKALWVTPEAAAGLKTVALAYILAFTTLLGAWRTTPRFLDDKTYYELVFWGGGHVLQVANVAAMLAVWLMLLASLLNRPVVSTRTAWFLFALLLAPHLSAPLLVAQGTTTSLYRLGFTRLMQFGIFPVGTALLVAGSYRLYQAFRDGALERESLRDPRFLGFCGSAILTIAGFFLGSAIRDANTMIPAHYHASIGAVTLSFMAITYVLLPSLDMELPGERSRRLVPWQLCLFGGGQLLFALGFGWAGFHGLGRKMYATEQHVRTLGEYVGLGVMGVGGLIAILGGLLFLALVVWAAVAARVRHHDTAEENVTTLENI